MPDENDIGDDRCENQDSKPRKKTIWLQYTGHRQISQPPRDGHYPKREHQMQPALRAEEYLVGQLPRYWGFP